MKAQEGAHFIMVAWSTGLDPRPRILQHSRPQRNQHLHLELELQVQGRNPGVAEVKVQAGVPGLQRVPGPVKLGTQTPGTLTNLDWARACSLLRTPFVATMRVWSTR